MQGTRSSLAWAWPKGLACTPGPRRGDGNIPAFLAAKNLQPFISEDLATTLTNPVLYITPGPGGAKGGGNVAHGIRAELIPDVCDVWLKAPFALLGALAGSAGAGDLTVQEAYPGSRLRPGSDANPYELRQNGRTLGRLEEESPPTRWLVPGTESNPYRVRPRRDAIDDGFGAFDDDEGDE